MKNLRKEETITIMRKNVIKITAIALLSAFALTACDDDIIAKPTGYGDNSPVVDITGFNGTVYNNDFTDIYDAIRSSNIPSDVLDLLLYQYSVSVFGNYNAVTAANISSNNKFGDITLKKAVAGLEHDAEGNITGGNADTKAFIKAHSAYWNKDKNGKRVKDDLKTEAGDDDDPSKFEYIRLENKWKTIEQRIAKQMYSAISGGSYSDENIFDEAKYLRSLAESIENNVISLSEAGDAFKGVLTSKVEDYDLFNEEDEEKSKTEDIHGVKKLILQRKFYQSNYKLADTESTDQDATYIEDHLIPGIYRQLLVEQYLLDESYDTLGRTSARHISVLSIAKNSNYAKGAANLMNTFVNTKIFDNARTDKITLDTFKKVSNAWIGTFMDDGNPQANYPYEYGLMDKAVSEYKKASTNSTSGYYFQGTAFGDMVEEMDKIDKNPKISENEGSYTGSNAYSTEVGKEIKKRELQLQDHTFTGWYIKSVGVSNLPDSIKNQLFDINVANALNGEKCVEYRFDNGEWKTNEKVDAEGKEVKQGSLINVVGKMTMKDAEGKDFDQYFLRNTTRIKGDPVQNDILFESDGTYYIVLVEDAIRSTNLNKDKYKDAETSKIDKLEEYINEIVQIVCNNDTYKNLSKKHWLEEMNIKYHDTEVYEYFKTNFPELFEDD